MTDPLTAFIVLALGIAMVIVVIGGGVWMCVRAADADHPPVKRTVENEAPSTTAPVMAPITEPITAPLAS